MVADGLARVYDAYHLDLKLQFFAQLTQYRGCRIFIVADPAAGQAPGKAGMIRMFYQQHPAAVVKNNRSHAYRVSSLESAKQQVGQPQYQRKSTNE